MQIYLKKPILSFFQIIAVYINLFSNSAPFLLPLSPANVQLQTSPSHNAYTPECSGPPAPANSLGIRHRIPRISVRQAETKTFPADKPHRLFPA